MKSPYRYTTVSLYGADYEHLGSRDAGPKLDVLALQWSTASPDDIVKARAAAWTLVKESKKNNAPARVVNVRISDTTKARLAEIGNGNVSAGVRLVLGLARDVTATEPAARRTDWYTLTLRTKLMARLHYLVPGKDISGQIAHAMLVWDALPLPIANMLFHTRRDEDLYAKDEEGASGAVSAKLERDTMLKLKNIGNNTSEGARIVLRTLADLIEGRITLEHCEGFNHRDWLGKRFPKLPSVLITPYE